MKTITKTIAAIATIILTSWSLMAQEGHVVYDVTMESDQPEVQSQIGMLAGSTMEVYFKDNLSKSISTMGSFITTTTVSDTKSGDNLMLVSGMMGKLAAKGNSNDKEEDDEPELSVELIDETKEILGYTCKKAIITTEEGIEMEYWYTEDIKAPKVKAQGFNDKIPGLPLAFIIVTPQMTMTYTAKEVSDKVKKAKKVFSMEIPDGYTEKSMEEIQNMMGGGQ